MRIFLTKWMARFSRQENLAHKSLRESIARAERGLIDADLGGGLIKQRVARSGKGRSGGYRTIIAYRRGIRAVLLLSFSKSERENIGPDDLTELRKIGSNWLSTTPQKIAKAIEEGILQEVEID